MGTFVKKMNNIKGISLVMAHELIFIMQGGNMGVLLMFGHGEKMVQFYNNPKSRVGMNVWS